MRHSQRVDRVIALAGVGQSLADHRHNRLQMFPRGQFRHHTAVRLVRGDLREDNIGKQFLTRPHDSSRRLVARAFNAKNVSAHMISLFERAGGQILAALELTICRRERPARAARGE